MTTINLYDLLNVAMSQIEKKNNIKDIEIHLDKSTGTEVAQYIDFSELKDNVITIKS
ncbi:hypothetical protein H6K86_11995 [Staphylococcus epidermidis]|nr:hypothetical protein [Staphylococcus epidermidis]MBM6209899.1 hypothetical protein [Staphylococcus epidermidis]MBM6212254.1 hypothetical protein [Staphylococcus epidermidis]MBM6219283.1 hypothetical protein [Staphylococcus epidermidis]MBM6223805.1 hypothetical protein [Staphylococcus epidermidis]